MKYLFHALIVASLLLLSVTGYAEFPQRSVKSVEIDMSSTPVPIIFDAANPASRVLTGLYSYSHLAVLSNAYATCSFEINTTHDTTAPSSNDSGSHYLYVDVPGVIFDGLYVGRSIYLRATHGSPCNTGKISVAAW